MATVIWRGDAPTVAQVDTVTFSLISDTDFTTFTINGKSVVVTATTSTLTQELFAAACATALEASTIPEFEELTFTSDANGLYCTGPSDGRPFTMTATGTNMTASRTTTTTASSPNDASLAANWVGGALPVNSDTVIFENSDVDCLWNLGSLSAVTLASLQIKQSYTGNIGLPLLTSTGYYEYRTTELTIGATSVRVGDGEGNGSSRCFLNLGSAQTAVLVTDTGSAEDPSVGALVIRGTHASNVLRVARGDVGVAMLRSTDTATFATVEASYIDDEAGDSRLRLGPGCTLTTVEVYGGRHDIYADLSTLTVEGGSVVCHEGVSPATAIDVMGGLVEYRSSGTLTQGYVAGDGELVFWGLATRTVTNLTLYTGATVRDKFKTVTFTNPIVLTRCALEDVTLELGSNINIART